MATRGAFAILFGLTVLLWRSIGLGALVTLFGVYACLDGIAAIAWGVRASRQRLEGWPVVVEGIVSVALGIVVVMAPFQAGRFVDVIAVWALVTGVLEIVAALPPTHGATAPWSLAAAGVWSIFLSLLVVSLPHALTDTLVDAIGVYALVFGVLVCFAAFRGRPAMAPVLRRRENETWTTR